MNIDVWKDLYTTVQKPCIPDTLVGFNLNLDRILQVTPGFLDSALLKNRDLAQLRSRLIRSMQHCTAEEWFVKDLKHYRRFSGAFSSAGSLAIGGQAGIAALHLAGLGAGRVVCATPLRSKEAAAVLTGAGVTVPDLAAGTIPVNEQIHLVFEYPPGLVSPLPGIAPRHNRFIISPDHGPASVILPEKSMELILSEVETCRCGFLSGYQYLRTGREFRAAADQLRRIKERSTSLRVHVEWVSVTDPEISLQFVRHILPFADSLGLNGQELLFLLAHRGNPVTGIINEGQISPLQIIEGAIGLSRELELKRLHVHTFGYYVLVIRGSGTDPEVSRNALLFAAQRTADAARGTRTEISAAGLAALETAAGKYRQESPGIFRGRSCRFILVPTLLAENITKTSGLGDILSSTAFVSDRV